MKSILDIFGWDDRTTGIATAQSFAWSILLGAVLKEFSDQKRRYHGESMRVCSEEKIVVHP